MRIKSARVLPKTANDITNGGLYRQRVRCGKDNCKCANGEPHTAFYFFTRRGGKLLKFYVRKADIVAFAALVGKSAIERQSRRQAVKSSGAMLRTFRLDLMQNDGLIKTIKDG